MVGEWAKLEPPQQATCMPAEAAFASVVVLATVFGRPFEAVHVLLAFCGCLRIGESLALMGED
eukprot:224554-Lingulodinium_polyedra.AAC.1